MKVNELKPRQLEEGFLDNLITKVQDMAGGDGLTGIVRSLRGQGASLNRVADTIKNGFTGTLRARLGNNFQAVASGQGTVPAADIIKLALKSAEKVASADGNPVSAGQLIDYFKKNKRVITTAVGAGVASVVDAIVDVANKQEIVSPMPYEQFVDGVSKALASAVVLIQSAAENGIDGGEMDEDAIKQFEQTGQALLSLLLDPTNGLKPNQDYKDNIENLFFVEIVKEVKDKYVALPNEKLTALAANPPELINQAQLKPFLISHNPSIDPGVVASVTQKAHELIQNQFKIWLGIAAQETSTGAKAEQSLQLYSTWLQKADNMLQSLKLGSDEPANNTSQDAGNPPAGKPITPAGKPETVTIGGEEIKPNDPLYDKIMAAVNGTA